MFHVYNKFDSMDCVHVYASTKEEAVQIAIADGFLTKILGVEEQDVAAFPFLNGDQTSMHVRRISREGVLEVGR